MHKMKSWFFPFFFLVWLFSGELFSVFLSATGGEAQSGILQRFLMPIAFVAYAILFRDLYKVKIKKVRDNIPYQYYSRFLRFASICVAGIAVGIHLAIYPCYEKVDVLLPLFILVVLIVLGIYGIEAALNNTVVRDDGEGGSVGLNYQVFSYHMAKVYTYCLYFLSFSTIRRSQYYKLMIIPVILFISQYPSTKF